MQIAENTPYVTYVTCYIKIFYYICTIHFLATCLYHDKYLQATGIHPTNDGDPEKTNGKRIRHTERLCLQCTTHGRGHSITHRRAISAQPAQSLEKQGRGLSLAFHRHRILDKVSQ